MNREKYDERTGRLFELLQVGAPPILIANECRLVLGAFLGGGRLAIAVYLLGDYLAARRVDLMLLWERWSCRLVGGHCWVDDLSPDGELLGTGSCHFCGTAREGRSHG